MDLHGWQPDPFGTHEERLFRHGRPTPLVRDGGIGSYDEESGQTSPTAAPSVQAPSRLGQAAPPSTHDSAPALGAKSALRDRRFWVWLVVVACITGASAIALAVVLAGTGSPTTAPSTTSRTPVASTRPSTQASVPSASTQPQTTTSLVAVPSAASAIGRSFNTVFDFANGVVSEKLDAIQDGTTLDVAMTQAVSSSYASTALGARIDTYQMLDGSACAQVSLPAPCAQVTYDILGPGVSVILSGSQGYAVSVDGQWLVAKGTVCSLFGLLYEAAGSTATPPGCSTQ